MMRPPEASVIFSSTPSAPIKKRLFLTNYEDELITAVVVILLAGMFLAYLCLCCHVWGLHLRLFQLIKSLRSSNDTNESNGERREEGRPSFSSPVVGTTLDYTTPPPRYSLVADSLPTYSCAIIRMVGHLRDPVGLRILVYVNPDTRDISTFSDTTPVSNRIVSDLRHSTSTTTNRKRDNSTELSHEVLSSAPGCSSRSDATSGAVLENHAYLSDISGSLYSIQSDTFSIGVASDHSSICELSVLSATSQSSIENRVKLSDSAYSNDTSNIPLPVLASSTISPIQDNAGISVNTSAAAYTDENNSRSRPNWSQDISDIYSSNSTPSLPSSRTPQVSFNNNTYDVINNQTLQENDQSNRINNESLSGICVSSVASREHQVPNNSSDLATSSGNRSPSNSIRLLMRGVGEIEQEVYALKNTNNCYVANWPILSQDFLDSEYLEVVVHGQPVEDIFMEFLNKDGELVGMSQLVPSPTSMLPSISASSTGTPNLAPSSPPPPTSAMPPPYRL